MANAADAYVKGFRRLMEGGCTGQAREVLLARLDGKSESVHGLVSPSLLTHEPNHLLLFYHLYRDLTPKQDNAPQALECFRRLIMEQYLQTLHETDAPTPRLDDLARLVAFCHVTDTPALARQLLGSLWGYLMTLPPPLEEILIREASKRSMAYAVLELWVATSHPNLGNELPPHQVSVIRKTLDAVLKAKPENLDLLFTLYNAAVKVMPEEAGKKYFIQMHRMCTDKAFLSRWRGMCWRHGCVLETDPAWAKLFLGGLKECCVDPKNKNDDLTCSLEFLEDVAIPLLEEYQELRKTAERPRRSKMAILMQRAA